MPASGRERNKQLPVVVLPVLYRQRRFSEISFDSNEQLANLNSQMAHRTKKDLPTDACAYCRHEVDHASLGHDLRALREHAGLSQKEVAYGMGISPGHLCDLELGQRRWTAALVKKCMAAIRGIKP